MRAGASSGAGGSGCLSGWSSGGPSFPRGTPKAAETAGYVWTGNSLVHLSQLEEQFRDFKLKPKVLMDLQKHSESSGGRKGGRGSRSRRGPQQQCVFCLSNGEDEAVYRSHSLKDHDGRVTCPLLRMYCCPICNYPGGDYAHTMKYCPKNKAPFKHLLKKAQPQPATPAAPRE